MNIPTKEELCIFIENSISNRQYNEEILFHLPNKTIEVMNLSKNKKKVPFNMTGYKCLISSHAIRHINKKHSKDLEYICEIIEILENFTKVEKSLTKCAKTGANLISLEFYKKFEEGTVKLVKLRIHREKKLELKTLFLID